MNRDMEREPDKETWQVAIAGHVVLKQYTQQGDLGDVVVAGGRKFHISPKERRINQEMAATEDLDMFSDGTLVPVSLIEGSEDAAKLANNPNIISESEMKDLFSEHWKKFDERVDQIANQAALQRLLEMASDPESGATVRQAETIKARLAVLNPNAPNEHVQLGEGRGVTLRPVTPS
jgi:hypothetical protein